MKPYPNEELDRMSKREIIRLYKRTVEQFNDSVPVIRCKDCKNSEPWYADKHRCFLWSEDGIDVFDDGFCNYAERKEE